MNKRKQLISKIPLYVELLARSNYSFLQGASFPEEMVITARKLGYKGIALADINGAYGLVRGYRAAYDPSCFDEQTLTLNSYSKTFHFLAASEIRSVNGVNIVILPKNSLGYKNFNLLISKGHSQNKYFHIELDDILEHSEGLYFFPLPPWKIKDLEKIHEAASDRFFLPVWQDQTWARRILYTQALELERKYKWKAIACQRPLFHIPQRKCLFDVLNSLYHKKTLKTMNIDHISNAQRYLKPLRCIFQDFYKNPEWIERTYWIANSIDFSIRTVRYEAPHTKCLGKKTPALYLRSLCEQGLDRYADTPELVVQAKAQLEKELMLIAELGYEDYFLTIWDICEFAKKKNILYQGRGSAANSIVCFLLSITNIDPLKYNLLFERFISKERGEPPDIDIDFEHDRREEIITYIYQKYGNNQSALLSTINTFRSRSSLREVGKAFGFPKESIKKMNQIIDHKSSDQLDDSHYKVISSDKIKHYEFRKFLEIVSQIKGFPRHLGTHPGGFIISHSSLCQVVPTQTTALNRSIIQWNKDDTEYLKIMKFDILGLGVLTFLKHSFALLKKYISNDWQFNSLPKNDNATFALIRQSQTIGVFQLESRAQMAMSQRLKPKEFYDLVIQLAIIRPGPIQGKMVHPYLKQRENPLLQNEIPKDLIPILKKTLGIPLFQEQIIQIAVLAADFTPGEADELRRLMSQSWLRSDIISGLRRRLLNGMLQKGYSKEYAERIFNTIQSFASYGFPESHAASFALLTYASSYIKTHYPAIFFCALLNSQPLGFYPIRVLVQEAKKFNILFQPLDINDSEWDFTIEKINDELTIRTGFRQIRGLIKSEIEKLLNIRTRIKIWRNFYHFLSTTLNGSVTISPSILQVLAKAGAYQTFDLNPREAIWNIKGSCLKPNNFLSGICFTPNRFLPKENVWEKTQREFSVYGYSLDEHPVKLIKKRKGYSGWHTQNLKKAKPNTNITVWGGFALLQRPPTAKGFAFLLLEDEYGLLNIILSPNVYEKHRLTLQKYAYFSITGELQSPESHPQIRCKDISPL